MISNFFFLTYFLPFKDSKGVEYLCDNNFTQILKQDRNALIFFKSETCPHCMEFTPTYHLASRIYAHKTKFYISMHEKCPGMSRYYQTTAFPTLIASRYGLRHSRCEKRELFGGLKDCINEKFMEAGKYLETINDLIDTIDKNQSFFLVDHKLSYREQFEADKFTPDIQFYSMTSFDALHKILPGFQPKGSVVYYRASDREFFDASKTVDSKLLQQFLDKHQNSTIFQFSTSTVNDLFIDNSTLVLVRFDKTKDELDNEEYLYLENAAIPGKNVIYFTTETSGLFNDVIDPPDDIEAPVLAMVTMNGANPPRWINIQDPNDSKIAPADFITRVLEGKVETYMKSEKIPLDNSSPVKKIVGRNFHEEVEKSTKPYVLLLYNKEAYIVNKLIDTLAEAQMEIGDSLNFGFLNIGKNETPLDVKEQMPIIVIYQNGEIIAYYSDRQKMDLPSWIRTVLSSNEL